VAELLVVKGTTTLDLMVGKSTGARAGWPEDRVAAVAQYGDALRQSAARASPSLGPAMWSCESVQAANRYLRAVAEVGEVAAARDAMLQSGNTPAELATQWQEFLNSLQREGSVR
jgi:tRNA U34 5-methylaminomethyl-2-thiouridine-forming methyltransferase MnmC